MDVQQPSNRSGGERPSRITICRSTDRTATGIMRELDGERRRLIVQVPWTQRPSETFEAVRDQLFPEERRALAAAFDLDGPDQHQHQP